MSNPNNPHHILANAAPSTGTPREEQVMVMELENPISQPRGRSRIEVWLFIAVALIGLLGFMASLSTGDIQETAGGDDSKAAAIAQP
jgi:hypothetical protein